MLVGLEDVNELWDMCFGIGLNENNFTMNSYILLKVSF